MTRNRIGKSVISTKKRITVPIALIGENKQPVALLQPDKKRVIIELSKGSKVVDVFENPISSTGDLSGQLKDLAEALGGMKGGAAAGGGAAGGGSSKAGSGGTVRSLPSKGRGVASPVQATGQAGGTSPSGGISSGGGAKVAQPYLIYIQSTTS